MAGTLYALYELGYALLLCSPGLLAAWLILRGRLTPLRIVMMFLLSFFSVAAVTSVLSCSFFDSTGLCVDAGHSALRNSIAVHPLLLAAAVSAFTGSLAALLFRRKDCSTQTLEGRN